MEDLALPLRRLQRLAFLGLLVAALPALAQTADPAPVPVSEAEIRKRIELTPKETAEQEAWDKQQQEVFLRGRELLDKGEAEAAIRDGFEPVIAAFETRYAKPDTVYFCTRTLTETLLYLGGLAAEHEKSGLGKNGVALGPLWAYAYFQKGYALVELNRFDEAAVALDKALLLSPKNPMFLIERGTVYRASGEWDKMLASNQTALSYIDLVTPDDQKDWERAHALRGQGYALIELGKLDEAEKSFKKSMKIEPKSKVALNELEYIKQLRKKK